MCARLHHKHEVVRIVFSPFVSCNCLLFSLCKLFVNSL